MKMMTNEEFEKLVCCADCKHSIPIYSEKYLEYKHRKQNYICDNSDKKDIRKKMIFSGDNRCKHGEVDLRYASMRKKYGK